MQRGPPYAASLRILDDCLASLTVKSRTFLLLLSKASKNWYAMDWLVNLEVWAIKRTELLTNLLQLEHAQKGFVSSPF